MELNVYRFDGQDAPRRIGILGEDLSFRSLDAADSTPSDVSRGACLPLGLTARGPAGARPFIENLLPEGPALDECCRELGVAPGDVFGLLRARGGDVLGDLMFCEGDPPRSEDDAYQVLTRAELIDMFRDARGVSRANGSSRLSLAGTQMKTGLARISGEASSVRWCVPRGRAASTHILKKSLSADVLEIEYLCMRAAAAMGIECAAVELIDLGVPVLAVERFDREALPVREGRPPRVRRLHSEELAQVLGVCPAMKYRELGPSTAARIARLIRLHSCQVARDLEGFARIALFNYLVGNCDNHLKNLSFRWRDDRMSLAPAYDLVSTTRWRDLSREMGMALGGQRDIDAVTAADIEAFFRETGMSSRVGRRIAGELCRSAHQAILGAADTASPAFAPLLEYLAENIVADMEGRSGVLQAFADAS